MYDYKVGKAIKNEIKEQGEDVIIPFEYEGSPEIDKTFWLGKFDGSNDEVKRYACEIFTFISCTATKLKLFVYIRSSRIKKANALFKAAQRRLKKVVKTNNEYCDFIKDINNKVKNRKKNNCEKTKIIAQKLRSSRNSI